MMQSTHSLWLVSFIWVAAIRSLRYGPGKGLERDQRTAMWDHIQALSKILDWPPFPQMAPWFKNQGEARFSEPYRV